MSSVFTLMVGRLGSYSTRQTHQQLGKTVDNGVMTLYLGYKRRLEMPKGQAKKDYQREYMRDYMRDRRLKMRGVKTPEMVDVKTFKIIDNTPLITGIIGWDVEGNPIYEE